jgi:hypothetical protein
VPPKISTSLQYDDPKFLASDATWWIADARSSGVNVESACRKTAEATPSLIA